MTRRAIGSTVNHIFTNEASLGFSYDYFETGLGDGPGTWPSLADDTIAVLRNQAVAAGGARRTFNAVLRSRFRSPTQSVSAVVTDPPYDNMIDYSDASDLFYVWLKRALLLHGPVVRVYVPRAGVQEKDRRNHRQTVPGLEDSDRPPH